MSVVQRSLGPISGGNGSLRTPFVAAVLVLLLIWSVLSLDMSRVRSTVEPVYTGVVDSMKQAEDDAIRIALGSISGYSGSSGSEITSVLSTIPTPAPEASPNAGEQPQDLGKEAEKGATTEKEASVASPATIPSSLAAEEPANAPQEATKNVTSISPVPLVLYAYKESKTARPNLEFFIRHALNSAADFVFILNGPTNAKDIIPDLPNIRIVQRKNDCYDLGAYAEVLQKDDLWKKYEKFIMLNASLRGPFMPYWSNDCWMDMYLRKLTEEVKLVGMTANCWPTFHVQSMIWATDSIGLSTLLFPPEQALAYLRENDIRLPAARNKEHLRSTSPAVSPSTLATRSSRHNYRYLSHINQAPGINSCFHTWDSAVAAEVSSTALIRAAGYKVDVMMAAFHGIKELERMETCEDNGDVLFEGTYFGGDISVLETGWWKTNRGVDDEGLMRQTKWMRERGYKSSDFCSKN